MPRPAHRLSLRKNDLYWRADEGLPRFDTVIYRIVGENPNANIAALLAGECDIVDQTSQLDDQSELLLELHAAGQVAATFVTGTIWEHADFGIVTWNDYQRPDFFGDVRTCRAIAHCIDRQTTVDTVTYGQSVVLDSYLPPDHPLFNPDVSRYDFDIEQGKALLEEAGWIDDDGDSATPRVAQGIAGVPDGTQLEFTYTTTTAEQRQKATLVMQATLAECGVKINLDYRGEGALDDNAATQSLPDTPEYEQYHLKARRIFAEQLPVVPLYLRLKLAATRPDLRNFIMDPTENSGMWNIEEFELDD